jgi:hypothetical protein
MKTTASGILLATFLIANPIAGQETETKKEPTRAERAEALASKMENMRDDYQDLLAECWGKGYYLYDGDEQVWHLSEAPDPESCKEAESLKDDYRRAYKKLLELARRRVLFEDIPPYIDRE